MASLKSSNSTSRSNISVLSHVKYEHLIAGISGGVTSTLILHPLDLIKIRFAVNDGRTIAAPRYSGLSSAFATILKQEGVRGLYRGVVPNICGSGSAWGFYFLFYNSIKNYTQGGNTNKALGPTMHMSIAAAAGIFTLAITNPIWVVKTRLCLQYDDARRGMKSEEYKGMVDAFRKIYHLEGVKGLYRGFIPGMFGVSHGALQFMTYEEMKTRYNIYRKVPIDTKMGTLEYLIFAAISKLIAAAATYPYQVVRARLQDQHNRYTGTWDCICKTWRYESWRGFYKGLGTNLIRVTPATMITFLTYEQVSHFLLSK
ncbi:mitochondrial folate transporter/carrier-like [Ctenocephalides felis]|uniref:mitochondrial folate transporter/carrier-like n=1 Tax=Ctenocephalides felis TaxID=7515 RepID=UPI000E6E195B|nr:mitochondrial folate transporter/carrier-like [Ctenocephalides felis]